MVSGCSLSWKSSSSRQNQGRGELTESELHIQNVTVVILSALAATLMSPDTGEAQAIAGDRSIQLVFKSSIPDDFPGFETNALPVDAQICVEALVTREYSAPPVRLVDFDVKLEVIVIQSDSDMFDDLVVEPDREVGHAAVILANVCIQPVEATSDCPSR